MRVLQLSTTTSGGAGIAARRLNAVLVSNGIDSTLLTGSKQDSAIFPNEAIHKKSLLGKVKSKGNTAFQKYFVQSGDLLTTVYSASTIELDEILKFKPDLVHLHSYYNFLSIEALDSLRSAVPLVVTLHDERFLTGACHCTVGCDNFSFSCQNCPQTRKIFHSFVERNRTNSFLFKAGAKPIDIISPSKWIKNQVEKMAPLGGARTHLVRNPIPESFVESSALERKTNRSTDYYIVTFVAQDLFNPYKGLATLLQSVEENYQEYESQNIRFQFVGSGPNIEIGMLKYRQIDFVDEKQIHEIYQDTNLLIVPSLTDNSPNVIFESLVSGVPFACSNRAGLPELASEFGMQEFPYGNSNAILAAILKQKNSDVDSHGLRNTALSKISSQVIGREVEMIYKNALLSWN